VQNTSFPATTFARIRKTRIAPTPSGYLHLGNVLSFALTSLLAERYGAKVLLRIDDLDQQRVRPEYVQDIFDTLHFLELPWHEGPSDAASFAREYSQLHRMPQYQDALRQLKDARQIFACDCSRSALLQRHGQGFYTGTCLHKQLPLDGSGTSWRLLTDTTPSLSFRSLKGVVTKPLPEEQRYFVVKKKDGFPAYQLASVIDDACYGIDLVVRGADLFPSTLAQVCLAEALGKEGFKQAVFHHHGLLSSGDGTKLSKSAGATSVRYLRKEGKKPSDIFTLIGRQLGMEGAVMHWRDLAPVVLKGIG
jgi:glutamyl-tRNA synthetase